MSFLKFFFRNKKDANSNKNVIVEVYAPTDGNLVKMEDIPDEAFSSGALGQCFAIKPTSSEVFAPICGKVKVAYETGHAYFLEEEASQVSILVHLGIDTVNIKKELNAFKSFVVVDQKVTQTSKISSMNLKTIRANAPSDLVICAIQNDNLENKKVVFIKKTGLVKTGNLILRVESATK